MVNICRHNSAHVHDVVSVSVRGNQIFLSPDFAGDILLAGS
jgi:hypothetical protein